MTFHLHRSNRAERLVEALADVVRAPPRDALAAETIVVQGKGMERWLAMQLAERLGVWANPSFPFPRRFIESVFAAVLGEENGVSRAFEPETMVWSIAERLRQLESQKELEEIRTYLRADDSERKRLQLAERVARAFDEYVVYRPDVLLGWQKSAEGGGWQALLWRELVAVHGERHLAFVARELLAALRRGAAADGLPERVAVFGISTLPPLYLELLYALAEKLEIHFFLLSPSSEFWATSASPREMQRQRERLGGTDERLHLEPGHPLLASLGRLGRDFLDLVVSAGDYQESEGELFVPPGTDSMLHALQSDILALADRGGRAAAADEGLAPWPAGEGDSSIRVHSCHGPMREVEVLHDQVLDLFARDPSLQPRDVVVLAPSIAAYAPFIEAVFGSRRDPAVPYRIADRGARSTRVAADAFLTLLEVLQSRLPVSRVLDLLAFAPIRDRFGIAEEELEQARRWIADAGVRWAADAGHREAEGQPPLVANTWRFGLERLLLGYAMAGEERTVYHGVLPYDDIEGTETLLLGRVADFCETLFAARARVEASRGLDDWRDALGDVLEQLLRRDEASVHEHQDIRNVLAALADRAREGRFTGDVDLATVAAQIEADLERGTSAHGFLGAGITFCELVPMRSIPFRVVCLLGMNDADFPRIRRRPGFDLMAETTRRGDRSSRDDDRYLFLEALLSARDHLVITYVGQSITDNSEIPPSVVASELLDALDRSFRRGDGEAVRTRVVVRHPLQPFSPAYFNRADDRLFSYVREYCAGARTLRRERAEVAPFVRGQRQIEDGRERAVDLDELARFFANPARGFLQALGIYLGKDSEPIEDREPLEFDNLDEWKVGDELLRRICRGEKLADLRLPVRTRGVLPPGTPGDVTFEEVAGSVEAIVARARAWRRGAATRIEVDLRPPLPLKGLLRDVWNGDLIATQYSMIRAKHELEFWIRHLALNAQTGPRASLLVARDSIVRFAAAADAAPLLADLLELYRLGLAIPLPFFPGAACAYATAVHAGDDAASARGKAHEEFTKGRGGGQDNGEDSDPYIRQIYRGADPLDPGFRLPGVEDEAPAFADVAVRIFGPLLARREVVE